MSSRNCAFGCRPPYGEIVGGSRHRPCPACMRKHERDMHKSWLEYEQEKQARIIDAILPATDREWEAQLDQVAPVVTPTFSLRFDLPRSLN